MVVGTKQVCPLSISALIEHSNRDYGQHSKAKKKERKKQYRLERKK
jgi:hypothetical protein